LGRGHGGCAALIHPTKNGSVPLWVAVDALRLSALRKLFRVALAGWTSPQGASAKALTVWKVPGLVPAQFCRRFFGRWLTRNSIWSARMLRLDRIRCSTQLGR